MMANIELTSSEYESPNYTLVFTRKSTEQMPGFSEKHKGDLERVGATYSSVHEDPSPISRPKVEDVRTETFRSHPLETLHSGVRQVGWLGLQLPGLERVANKKLLRQESRHGRFPAALRSSIRSAMALQLGCWPEGLPEIRSIFLVDKSLFQTRTREL
jgi:hypothetical protein